MVSRTQAQSKNVCINYCQYNAPVRPRASSGLLRCPMLRGRNPRSPVPHSLAAHSRQREANGWHFGVDWTLLVSFNHPLFLPVAVASWGHAGERNVSVSR